MVLRCRWVLAASLLLALCSGVEVDAAGRATDSLIEFYQGRVARDPDDFASYNRLAAAYVQKARESGDLTWYGLAEKALSASLALVPDGAAAAPATTSLALVHLARHEFAEALRLAERAVALGGDVTTWAVVGDAALELGDEEKAAAAYGRLLGLTGPRHPHSRLAELAFLRGDVPAAIQHARREVAATREASLPAENVAWALARLADYLLHAGDVAGADTAIADALAAYAGYHRGFALLARVRAAQSRLAESVDLYRKAMAVIPLPEYAAQLGDVYTRLGQRKEAKKQYDLVEYIGALSRLNRTVYNRELALFYADHGIKSKEAVELAEKELEVRHDVYTWDVVAWARLRNGQAARALEAMQKALRLGTRDARLFFHAGMIHHRLGEVAKAREYLQRALATNPHFHVLHADVAARTLEALETRR